MVHIININIKSSGMEGEPTNNVRTTFAAILKNIGK